MTEEEEEEKQKRIHSIKNLYAFELFCQHRFDDSMQIFVKLGTGKVNSIRFNVNILTPNFN